MVAIGFTREEIARMGDPQLPDFMNALLWAEFSSLGVSPQDISENWHRYMGDGGIDHGGCSFKHEFDVTNNKWIPSSDMVWQYKAGTSFTVAKVKNELEKESHAEMRERVRDGATYVLVVSNWDEQRREEGRKKALEVFRQIIDCEFSDDRVVVYAAPQISEWSYERPHVTMRFGKNPGRLKPLKHMHFPRLSGDRSGKEIPFVSDARQSAVDLIRSKAAEGRGVLEVNGGPGLGKSRAVYEALNVEGFRDRTVVASDPSVINESSSLIDQLQDELSSGAIIVVDKLSHEEARSLLNWIHPLEQRNLIILITVVAPGASASTVTPYPLIFDVLEDSELAKILTQITGRTENSTNQIAGLLGGSPALAVIVGDILHQGDVDWSTLVTDMGLRNHISRHFQEPLSWVLRVVSIVPRVDKLQNSFARKFCALLELNWAQFIESLEHAVNIGVLDSIRDFYFFRSPLLGNWFAGEAWMQWKAQIRVLYEANEEFQDALVEVLTTLPHIEAAKEFAYKVGKQDFLEARSSWFSSDSIRRIGVLSRGFPEIALDTTSIAVAGATDEELASFQTGRQTLVNMLTEIVWNDPSTFSNVLSVMLRLADKDPTTWENNAAGTWNKMFYVYTGPGGVANSAKRVRLARELLNSDSLSSQLFGVRAARACLSFQEFGPFRASGRHTFSSSRASPSIVPEEGTAADARGIAMEMLKEGLYSSIGEVANAAWDYINAVAWDLMALGKLDDYLVIVSDPSSIPRSIPRETALFSVQNTFQRISYSVSKKEGAEDYIGRMDEIAALWQPKSIHERVRRFAGEWLHDDWTESQNTASTFSINLESLVHEVISNPTSLIQEIPWLLGPEPEHAVELGAALGRKDSDHELVGIIFDNLSEGCNPALPTGYLAGRINEEKDFVYSIIEQQFHSSVGAEIVSGLVRLVPFDSQLVDMLTHFIDSGFMTDRAWFLLRLGTWHNAIGQDQAKRLAEVVLEQVKKGASPQGTELILLVIFDRISETADSEQVWEESFFTAADLLAGGSSMGAYYWSELAKRYMRINPSRTIDSLLQLTLRMNTNFDLHPYEEELMSLALALHPKEFLDAIYLVKKGPNGYKVDIWFQFNQLGLQGAGTQSIVTWVEENGLEGARFIAQFVKPAGDPLGEPTATLISDFGYDSEVKRRLESNIWPNSWTGPYSLVLKRVKEDVEPWTRDTRVTISEWSKQVLQRLNKGIEIEEERERLEDLFGL